MVQAPTTDQEVLLDVVASLATGRRTAIGSAILESIDAIAEIDAIGRRRARPRTTRPGWRPPPVPQGAYAPAIIVLLTDGASNAGPEPVDAARAGRRPRAARLHDRLRDGRPRRPNPRCGAQFIGGEPDDTRSGAFGGGVRGRGRRRRRWRLPARDRRGHADGRRRGDRREYYPAESADELDGVLESLPTNMIMKHEVTEISVAFVALGALLLALAILLGQAWRPLP